ncbi:metal-dependent hydrolase [Salinigranum sp.]|uniref:metal-dependent hydrolase n=1 Tax=Salinigranum sp. TaxID=1966351 RepID=UPI003563D324
MSPPRRPALEYFGLSSFTLTDGETRLLVDPWVTDPDWTRATVSDFADVDAIFVTHGAYDHLGDTVEIADTSGASVYTEPAVADHLVREGLPESQVDRVIWGNTLTAAGVGVRVVETRHLSYFESDGQRVSGMPLGFHFELSQGSLYYVGDTSLFSDLELFVDVNAPDVVLLPVGSAPGDRAPLPPRDAAIATTWLSVDTVVPVHYVPGSDEVDQFRRELDRRRTGGGPSVVELSADERYEL